MTNRQLMGHDPAMDIKKAVIAAMQEYLLPELDDLKSGQSELRSELVNVNKRLDDVNLHLADQSRRIDAVREELNGNINAVRGELNGNINAMREELNGNINAMREELNGNINAMREELGTRIDKTNDRIDKTNNHIDAVREELNQNIIATNAHLDGTNKRLDKLFEIVVRREEHFLIANKVHEMDREIREIKQRLAA